MPCSPVCQPFRDRRGGWYCPNCDEPFGAPPPNVTVDNFVPIRGTRTYKAKGYVKALGGRWAQAGKTWWVPVGRLDEAIHAVSHLTDPEDAQAPGTGPQEEPWLCWECGAVLDQHQVTRSLSNVKAQFDGYWDGCDDD